MIEKEIQKQFTQDKIIENLCKYELFYQISLHSLVRRSEFDIESTIEKLDELALEIDPENVFYTIIAITRHYEKENDFKVNFEEDLQKYASVQALQDYVKNDSEMNNPEIFLESMLEVINENKFFDEKMKREFDLDYGTNLNRWKNIITETIATQILQNSEELF